MSDVYGRACKKIERERDPKITFSFWSMVTQLCHTQQLSSYEIMEFLEKSPPYRDILIELRRLRLVHRDENNVLLRYARIILKE